MSHLISARAKKRTLPDFTSMKPEGAPEGYKQHSNLLHLDYGTPNAGFFPIQSIKLGVKEHPFQTSEVPESSVVTVEQRTKNSKLIDLSTGLQYSGTTGSSQLSTFIKDFVTEVHKPACADWSSVVSLGAADGLSKAMDVFLDEGEVVLIEEFTFIPVVNAVANAGAIAVPVKIDFETTEGKSSGLDLAYLTELLENWDELKPELKGKKPKALYTISSGQNPSGFTQSLEMRKKVYSLAEKHDFAIIEDDPYGYLTLPEYKGGNIGAPSLQINDYLTNHLAPSYLSIDTTGRVLRIETFSKLFAPGLRLGFLVGHKDVIQAITTYASVVTTFPSGASQIILNNVIQENFGGVQGWLTWMLKIRDIYTRRKDLMLKGLYGSKAYENGYYEVVDPRAGMFVSVVMKFPPQTDVEEKMQTLMWKLMEHGVSVVAGYRMAVDRKFSVERGNFFRLSYAPLGSDEDITEAAIRFANGVEEFFQKGLKF